MCPIQLKGNPFYPVSFDALLGRYEGFHCLGFGVNIDVDTTTYESFVPCDGFFRTLWSL